MVDAIKNTTEVTPLERVRETYVERSALFGLLRWWEVIKTDSIGRELYITTTETPEKIYLNGRELTLKSKR